jgi:sulfide:quinone oxidoreductase
MEKITNSHEELIAEYLKSEGISRRDALKMMGIGAGVAAVGTTSAQAATAAHASSAKGKIVIIGGGMSGVATAAKLSGMLSNPDITIIEPNPKSVSYQPGQTLVATGIYDIGDIMYDTKDFMPSGVKWVQDKAVDIDGDSNTVKTEKNGDITYDYLVVAAGITLDYGAIKGLEEVGDCLSLDTSDAARAKSLFGKNGLNSIYFAEGAAAMWPQVQQFVADAKAGKAVKGVFPEPHTPFKCGGAQKKVPNLIDARLKEAGSKARANATLDFYTNGGKLFGVPEYHNAIDGQMKARDISVNYSHKFVAVDPVKKIATFEKHWKEEVYDEFLEMKVEKRMTEKVETDYDLLHVIPPQKAPDAIAS